MISTWSPSLQLQRGVSLGEGGRGRGKAVWVTDCAMMTNCNKLAMATTARELLFFDLSTTVYKCQYKVYGTLHLMDTHADYIARDCLDTQLCYFVHPDLPSVPLCMAYYYDPEVGP